MILTCPQCETRYRLTAEKLTPDGHHVRCTNCGEIWHQMPDPVELPHDLPSLETLEKEKDKPRSFRDHVELEFRDIPESVKPIRESVVLPKPPKLQRGRFDNSLSGYGAAVCIFLLIFGIFIFWKNDVVASWRPATLLYTTLGVDIPMPGAGLRFEDITARASLAEDNNGEFLEITGRIVNITSEDQPLLPVHAFLRDTEGKSVEEWSIEIPEKFVPANSAVSFAVSRLSKRKAEDVRLVFVFRTGEEDAENTPVLPLADHTLRPASE
jgi:predicted Zn finger-like uncharacterized protein